MAIRKRDRVEVKKPKIRKKRKLKRVLNLGKAGNAEVRQDAAERSHVSYISQHPNYDLVVGALREGTPVAQIARWFAERGMISVTERTFQVYLGTFKKRNASLLKPLDDDDTFDKIVGQSRPDVDVLSEMNKLYRLQKMRLRVDVDSEIQIGKLFASTHKEMSVAAVLLESIARVEGKLGNNGNAANQQFSTVNPEVADELRQIKSGESKRDKMYHLTADLVQEINNAQ